MASLVKPDDSGVIKGVYATVSSLDLSNHSCILRLERQRIRLGDGVLDTRVLEESLAGVSDLSTFLAIKRKFITKLKKLTPERKTELRWHGGTYEALWVRPIGIKPDVNRIPSQFVSRGRQIGQRSLPSAVYCQQSLVTSNGLSGLPLERTSDMISALRKILKHWDVFPLQEVLNVLRNRDEFSDLRQYVRSTHDIVSFAKSFPQYFVLTTGDRELGFPYRFMEGDYKSFLTQQEVRGGRRGVLPPYVLISDAHECQRQVRRLLQRARGSDQLILAVDCEGVNLGKEGSLTLLQISTMEGEVFVFDILATPNRADMFVTGGLKALLEDTAILKVIHDCRTDQCALYFQFGVVLQNVFDTSVAYTTLWEQCNVMGGPFRPKLAMLIEIYGLKAGHKTDAFAERVHGGELFGQRPLTQEMIEYAMDDVLCLVPTIYENMNRLISPLWRPHFKRKIELALAESQVTDPHLMYETESAIS